MYFPNKKGKFTQRIAMLLAVLAVIGAVVHGQPAYAASNAGTAVVAASSATSGLTGKDIRVSYTKSNYPDLKTVDYGTYRTLDYQEKESQTTYFYDFRKDWNTASRNDGIDYLMTKTIGFYGVTASAEKNVITYEAYSELDNVVVNGAEFHTYDDAKYNIVSDAPGAHTLNVAKLSNGPYKLCVWFDYTEEDGDVTTICAWTPVYVSNGEAWFASYRRDAGAKAMETWLTDNRNDLAADDAFQAWMTKNGGGDLDAALRLDHITYPFYSNTSRYPNDVSKWQALAHEICPDEDASDFMKAYLLHDWMANNLVYDAAHVDTAYRYTLYANSTTWETHLGMCVDFSNIYAIMCRELGVPCRLVGDNANNHAYNAVYLNGRWELVDLTKSTDSKKVGDTKAAITTFWEGWKGVNSYKATQGFLVSADSMYKIHSYETSKYKTVEDRLAKLDTPLDSPLHTRARLKELGGGYNH